LHIRSQTGLWTSRHDIKELMNTCPAVSSMSRCAGSPSTLHCCWYESSTHAINYSRTATCSQCLSLVSVLQ